MWRVRDLPARLRPREEMARRGAANVADDVLLAILLRSGIQGLSVVDLARELLHRYRSLTAMARASVEELAALTGMGPVKAQVLSAAFALAERLAEERAPARQIVRSPDDVVALLREKTRRLEEEVFWTLLLDAKNRLKGAPIPVTRGLLDASLVHPREAFREAVRSSSAAVVFAHNHPSGDPSPSSEDIRITRQLVKAGKVMNIQVMDHIILGEPVDAGDVGFLSMREAGLIEFET